MLQLIDLKKRFGDVVALDGAGFTVDRGRILGFLGPNGAGKTTAMRVVFGLVRPDSGTVSWNGGTVGLQQRLRFGYMPEERGLYPKMKIRDQLIHLSRLSGMTKKEAGAAVDHWLGVLGLSDRGSAKLEDLSHGNQQRVQLAAALAPNPELLILDEPFAGLDPIGVAALSRTLRELALGGVTVVFSSHQLDLVEDVCEDVAIINEGRVVLSGSLEEIRNRSSKRRLTIDVDGQPWIPMGAADTVVDAQGRSHCIVEGDAPIANLLAQASAAGTVNTFMFEPPRLTDLFREAVES